MFKKLLSMIKQSSYDKLGKVSSARLSSYIVLASIILNCLIFMGIEVTNAIIVWRNNLTYTIPSEHIIIFSLVLTHHIALLFYKSKEYTGGQSDFGINAGAAKENIDSQLKKQDETIVAKEEIIASKDDTVEEPG